MVWISLKPTAPDDLSFLRDLWNDGRVMKWVGFPEGVGATDRSLARWYDQRLSTPHFHHFIIVSEDGQRCSEVCFDLKDEYASLDIKLCSEAQGKGIATDALNELIDTAFNYSQDCQIVWTEPSADNQAARRLYTRCGLVQSARPSEMEQGQSFWALNRRRWGELRSA